MDVKPEYPKMMASLNDYHVEWEGLFIRTGEACQVCEA